MKYFKIAAFLFVFLFTFILRAHNYEKVPTPAHLDEQLYAWSGINLVERGVPISWSTLDYPKRAEVFKGVMSYGGGDPKAGVTLYKPWLDEPPLFSYMVGYSAHAFGADRNGFIPSSYIRFPVIFVSTITSIMVFLVGALVSGFWMGLFAMLLYGTVPLMVFASRTAMPENLIALLLMTSIYLLLRYQKKASFWYLASIPVLAGLAGLAKPTGYFIAPLAIFFVWYKDYVGKKTNLKRLIVKSLYILLLTLPFVAAYIWYGYHFDKEIFRIITTIQGSRPVGFGNLAWQLISPSYGTNVLKDSWFIFCLLSGGFYLLRPKKGLAKLISFSLIYWLAVVILSGGEGDLLAWYRFPYYPLLAICGAWGITYLYKKANFLSLFLAGGFLLGNRLLLVNAFRPNISTQNFRILFSLIMAPGVAYQIFKTGWLKALVKATILIVIVIGLYINTKYIYNAYEIACQSLSCPMVPTTWLSTLRFPFFWRFLVLK